MRAAHKLDVRFEVTTLSFCSIPKCTQICSTLYLLLLKFNFKFVNARNVFDDEFRVKINSNSTQASVEFDRFVFISHQLSTRREAVEVQKRAGLHICQ